jgi:hypothetical protein
MQSCARCHGPMSQDGGCYTLSVSLPAGSPARFRTLITLCSLRCIAAAAEALANTAELAGGNGAG